MQREREWKGRKMCKCFLVCGNSIFIDFSVGGQNVLKQIIYYTILSIINTHFRFKVDKAVFPLP